MAHADSPNEQAIPKDGDARRPLSNIHLDARLRVLEEELDSHKATVVSLETTVTNLETTVIELLAIMTRIQTHLLSSASDSNRIHSEGFFAMSLLSSELSRVLDRVEKQQQRQQQRQNEPAAATSSSSTPCPSQRGPLQAPFIAFAIPSYPPPTDPRDPKSCAYRAYPR